MSKKVKVRNCMQQNEPTVRLVADFSRSCKNNSDRQTWQFRSNKREQHFYKMSFFACFFSVVSAFPKEFTTKIAAYVQKKRDEGSIGKLKPLKSDSLLFILESENDLKLRFAITYVLGLLKLPTKCCPLSRLSTVCWRAIIGKLRLWTASTIRRGIDCRTSGHSSNVDCRARAQESVQMLLKQIVLVYLYW